MVAIGRSALRVHYGRYSEEATAIDRLMLLPFGVHLVKRGETSMWIYPLLSCFPVFVLNVVWPWFSQTHFSVICPPTSKGFLKITGGECKLEEHVWDPASFIPSVGSQLFALYGATKVLAHFLVLLDPAAVGTLSEFQSWQEKQKQKEQMFSFKG